MTNPYKVLRSEYVYCVACGSTTNLEAHHVKFRSRGGKEEDNLVMLCRACHKKRHDELIDISLDGDTLVVTDKVTGEIKRRPLVPQVNTGPSELVNEARVIQTWADLMLYSERLREETDESLKTLYDEIRTLKHRLWMVQAAIINEMQARASYGDGVAAHVAQALGCSERTVQSRGQIYREIISKPECSQACERLLGESWYKEAVSTDDPVHWINYADERKIENPRYTVAQFREEIRGKGDESSLKKVVLYCERQNRVDMRLAENLERKLGVPVVVVFEQMAGQVSESALVSVSR